VVASKSGEQLAIKVSDGEVAISVPFFSVRLDVPVLLMAAPLCVSFAMVVMV